MIMKSLEKVHEIKGIKYVFRVETSDNHRDYIKYEQLRNEVWDQPNDNLSGSRNMMCENFLHEGSSLFIGVFVESEKGGFKQDKDHLVGFSYGFVGIKDKKIAYRKPENLRFYSQYTCVRADHEHLGLGVMIKEFQKEILIEIFGIYTIICTYDPLTGVNAYRNIHHFGMEMLDYREAFYGDFGGLLNRLDIPCDRLFVTWDLKKEIKRPEYDLDSLIESGSFVVLAEWKVIQGRSGPIKMEIVKEINTDLDLEFLLIEIPVDFYMMLRETDVEENRIRSIPLDWRMKTRQAFKTLFERNYRIIDFRMIEKERQVRDFYILKKD
jgi:predicted GNAT superfamily acetyltransferase